MCGMFAQTNEQVSRSLRLSKKHSSEGMPNSLRTASYGRESLPKVQFPEIRLRPLW